MFWGTFWVIADLLITFLGLSMTLSAMLVGWASKERREPIPRIGDRIEIGLLGLILAAAGLWGLVHTLPDFIKLMGV